MLKGHEERIKEQDYLAWIQGQYTLSAVFVAVEHCLAGKKAKSQYLKTSILSEMFDDGAGTQEQEIKKAILAEQQYMAVAINKGLPETIIK